MRISVTIFVILISTFIVNASVLDPVIENVVHLKASKPPSDVPGIWKKKTIWKPRWVKEWKSAKVMKPVWRKVWSPVQIREWVPIPKPPPGWDSISTPLAPVHPKPQKAYFKGAKKATLKDSQGHHSFTVYSSARAPLWDPVPYPESQQPPPPPFPKPLYNSDYACGKGGCDNSPSQTFSHSQISEIIGPRYTMSDYYQNPEYSETVNHLTRLPPDENNWRPPQPRQHFQLDNRFNNFQGPSEFLVPPKLQSLPESNFPLQPINKSPPPARLPELEIQNSLRQWIPLPPENKIKGHFITKPPTQPFKFLPPRAELNTKNNTDNAHKELFQNSNGDSRATLNTLNQKTPEARPQGNDDVIQEAQLVGEYHYSEFDVPRLNKPQLNLEEKDEAGSKTQQRVKEHETEQKVKLNQQFVAEKIQKQTAAGINHVPRQSVTKQPENNQKQTKTNQTEGVLNTQDGLRVQKHISNSSLNLPKFNHNYQQHEAIVKEIFPVYKTTQNLNPSSLTNQRLATDSSRKNQETLARNDSSIKPSAIEANTTDAKFNSQQQKEIYPVFDAPKNVNPIFKPPNHRFQKTSTPLNNSTRLELLPLVEFEKGLPEKNNTVQLVFATTPDDYNHSSQDSQKTTTTEPYEIIFSSSLSTTEAATKSPIIIVTPANSNKS